MAVPLASKRCNARSAAIIWGLLLLFLAAQIGFARATASLRAAIEEIPQPLGPTALKGLALGDDQFLFRAVARWLQDVGDGGGRVRPLREYDYDRVVGWLKALDDMDDRSEYVYFLAAHYFGALSDPTTAPQRVGKIVEYLRQSAMARPEQRWSWLVWSAAKTQRLVKDHALALRLAHDLSDLRGNSAVPAWLALLAPPLYRTAGDEAAARALESDPRLIAERDHLAEELHRNLGR